MSGHQNIPEDGIAFVRDGITDVISGVGDNLVGVCSLAAGADQLFASLILVHGGRLEVIIPAEGYEATFSTPEDLERFRSLLMRADTVEKLPYAEPSEEAFLAAGRRVVENSDLLLAVWDGQPAKGKGGTADIVEYARSQQSRIEIIWPPGMQR